LKAILFRTRTRPPGLFWLPALSRAVAFAAITPARGDFAIKDGDTVVFLGDSITAARQYSKIMQTSARIMNKKQS